MLEGRHLMCAPVRDPGDKTMTIAAAQNNAPPGDSYACGATEVPLIEQTIGAFFADMVARQPERAVHVDRAGPLQRGAQQIDDAVTHDRIVNVREP